MIVIMKVYFNMKNRYELYENRYELYENRYELYWIFVDE